MEVQSIAATSIALFVPQGTSYQVPLVLTAGLLTYMYSSPPRDPDAPVYLSKGCTADGMACLY